MTRLQVLVEEAAPRITEISNYLCWNDCQVAVEVREGAFYDGGPVCIIPVMADGRMGHTAIKATYVERPFWVRDTRTEVA